MFILHRKSLIWTSETFYWKMAAMPWQVARSLFQQAAAPTFRRFMPTGFPPPPNRLLGMDKPFQQSPELRFLQGYKVYRILVEEPAPLVALFGYSARKGHRVLHTIHIKRLRTRTFGNGCSSIGEAHRHIQEVGHTFRQGSRDMAFRPHAAHGQPLLGRSAWKGGTHR